tara:strand:+ start:2503 stop:4980 length:2478 start_codon:yes stop_codon:yes gene_type:complete
MGTGYTRNDSSNNIADGNVINAADFDGEYDAIESAFNATSGHTHDGTTAEGGPVTVLGPVQDFVASSTEIKPKTDNTLDIGTSSLEFKDLYLDGKAYIDGLGETILVDTDKAIQFRDTALSINSSTDGQLDIDADTELELVAPTVDIDASTAVTIDTTTLTITGAANVTGDLDVDNININGNAIISTDSNGNIDLTPNGTGEVNISKVDIDSGAIDNTTIGASTAAAGTFTAIAGESAAIDNITIDANTISSTNSNGDITIDPNGTGVIDIPAATKLQLRDSAIFINSSTDGQLDIDADAELEITAPIVDIDASTSVNISNDLKLDSDAAIISLGADSEVTLTHEADTGIQAKAASGFELNLQTGDTSVEAGNVLGKITFNAPDEGSGTDALLDGASIEAIAEDTFASDNNSTALVFKTNTSAAATERMRIKSDGTIVMDTQVDIDNITIDGNAITSTNTNGNIDLTPAGTGEVNITKVDIDAGAIDGVTIGTNSAVTELQVDNININGNAITSTDSNGNIALTPNGTGDVQLDADTVRVGDSGANATITTNGTGDLILNTNAGTDSGSITIADAANGAISIVPNGTGNVTIGNLEFDADASKTDNHVLTYDGTAGTIKLEAIPAASITGNLSGDIASNGNDIVMADNDKIILGTGSDIQAFWDGTDGHIQIAGTLNVEGSGETIAKFIDDGAVELYHNNAKKIETVAAGVQVTGRATSHDGTNAITAENDGSFDLSANNNFSCTTAANTEITFSNTVAGQSGNIKWTTSSGHSVTANAVVGINATALAALQTAGTYNLSYYSTAASGSSSVLVSVSGALTSQGA